MFLPQKLLHLTPSQHSDLSSCNTSSESPPFFLYQTQPFSPNIYHITLSHCVILKSPYLHMHLLPRFCSRMPVLSEQECCRIHCNILQPRLDAQQINIGYCIFVENSLGCKFYLKINNLIFYFLIKINMGVLRRRLYKMLRENMRLQGKSLFAEAALS